MYEFYYLARLAAADLPVVVSNRFRLERGKYQPIIPIIIVAGRPQSSVRGEMNDDGKKPKWKTKKRNRNYVVRVAIKCGGHEDDDGGSAGGGTTGARADRNTRDDGRGAAAAREEMDRPVRRLWFI